MDEEIDKMQGKAMEEEKPEEVRVREPMIEIDSNKPI